MFRSAPPSAPLFMRVVFLLAVTLLALACPNAGVEPPSATGAVSGRALFAGAADSSGIQVCAEPTAGLEPDRGGIAGRATTAPDGRYAIGGLDAGTYTIYASSRDSLEQAVTTSVVVEPGRTAAAADLGLTPTGWIEGVATRAGASTGNLGVRVFLAGTSYGAAADDAGRFRMDRVPAGSGYTLVADAEGYDRAFVGVSVRAGERSDAGRIDLPVRAEPAGTGTVAGMAILSGTAARAGVFAYLSGTPHIAISDPSGAYLISGVPPGSYRLTAAKPGYLQAPEQAVSVAAGQRTEAGPLTLEPEKAAAPVMSPAGGTYGTDVAVQFFSPTPGGVVWFTVDGSTPVPGSGTAVSANSVVVSKDGLNIVRAICAATGTADSAVSSAVIFIDKPWAAVGTTGAGIGGFNRPWGCARDSDGRIYVADSFNHRIVRMDDMSGTNWTSYGTNGLEAGQFQYPIGIAVDADDRILVVDYSNGRIVRIDDMAGSGWTSFGRTGGGEGEFRFPTAIAVGPDGSVYVADMGNDRIVRFASMDGAGWTSFGATGGGTNQFRSPRGIAVARTGSIYVADTDNDRIVRFEDMTGAGFSTYGTAGSGEGQLADPRGVAVGANGAVYIVDTGNNRIAMLSAWASGWTSWGRSGVGVGQFASPAACWTDSAGRVYVPDFGNNRLVRFATPVF